MPKRKEEVVMKKAQGNNAILTMQIETSEGTISRRYNLPNFVGNTLAWQRSEQGMDDFLLPGLRAVFGTQVTPE